VDKTLAIPLAAELAGLQADLAGDDWKVIRHEVPRSTGTFGKEWGKAAGSDGDRIRKYSPDQGPGAGRCGAEAAVSHVLIVGHVAVPYSGRLSPDGHFQHVAPGRRMCTTAIWTPKKLDRYDGEHSLQDAIGRDNNANVIGDGVSIRMPCRGRRPCWRWGGSIWPTCRGLRR